MTRDELRKIAEAATQKWAVGVLTSHSLISNNIVEAFHAVGPGHVFEDDDDSNLATLNDCAFLKAFNPSKVLELLAELDAKDKEIEELREALEYYSHKAEIPEASPHAYWAFCDACTEKEKGARATSVLAKYSKMVEKNLK